MLAIHELQQHGAPPQAAIDEFLQKHQFPIVEGRNVTFVFRGPATSVELVHWIHGLQSAQAFQKMHDTDLWYLMLDIPEGSRVEYKLGVGFGHHKRLIMDPLNDRLARDPYGANSVVYGQGYEVPDWTREEERTRKGEIRHHELRSDAFDDTREVQVYLPARFRPTRRYPLLVVHDGPDYVQFAALKTVLDNLIHRLEVAPMVAALIRSPDRLNEYADDERHTRFLADELVPALQDWYPVVPAPQTRALMGASFGAVASLAATWRRPGTFGNVLSQSGSFVFTDIGPNEHGPVFDRVVQFMNTFRRDPGRPADRMFLSCGTYEGLIYYNRSLVPRLQAAGIDVRFREAPDGHNWENWRDRLREGLSWLFPGPLWMVYE
jgi:enterochelin esterase family protein